MQTTHHHTPLVFLSGATTLILILLTALGLVWGVGAAYYDPVLLAPTATTPVDSKFDSGSFAGDGWTVVNGAQTLRRWRSYPLTG